MKKLLIVAALMVPMCAWAFDDFKIATGNEGFSYEAHGYKVAASIKKQAKRKKRDIDVEIINTSGSLENIELLNDGEAQGAMVQADALSLLLRGSSRTRQPTQKKCGGCTTRS